MLDAKRLGFFACVVAVVVAAAVALMRSREAESVAEVSAADAPRANATKSSPAGKVKFSPAADGGEASAGNSEKPEETAPEAEEQKSEEERRQEEEEKKVEAFYALTDKWMGKKGGAVTMKDMDEFVAAFKSVPASRKGECLQRALNLVPDDNVLLLAGILFDKSIDKEHLELVFNDVLNRDEDVKKLILPKIFKDKEHPCWADTAWILDVTGELPKKEEKQ